MSDHSGTDAGGTPDHGSGSSETDRASGDSCATDDEGAGDTDRTDDASETAADGGPPLGAGMVTISETRSLEEDGPTAEAIDVVEAMGHEISIRERVGKDHDTVQATVSRYVDRDDVDFVITTGATSVEPTDVTLGAVGPLLDDELPAFGSLFTQLAFEEIGTHVVAGRTLCGVIDGVPVFCLPGNANATRLAVEEIVCPEVRHLVELATGDEPDDEEQA